MTQRRRYSGPLKAIILDWAGTTIDHGCLAPAAAFVELFERNRVPITLDEARGPMGIHKRDHIRSLLDSPSVRRRWQSVYGHGPTQQDVYMLFEQFLPVQLQALRK